jgi:hypothetical protein
MLSNPKSKYLALHLAGPLEAVPECELVLADAQRIEGESLQKSLQPTAGRLQKCGKKDCNPLKRFGSSGRIRTYNPSVNSRMLYR